MAVNYSTVAEKIFRVLKGHGYSVQMFDDQEGNEISNPQEARFFYVDQPNIMVNLSPENEEVKIQKPNEKLKIKLIKRLIWFHLQVLKIGCLVNFLVVNNKE